MLRKLWNRFGRGAATTTSRSRVDYRTRLRLEPLEERTLLSVSLTLSGTQTIVGGTNINVSSDVNHHQSEMTLDINPTNPLNLAGFSHKIDRNDFSDSNDISVFYSNDGGATWTENVINTSDDNKGDHPRFDPAIVFDAHGHLYIAYGVNDGDKTTLIVARSTNGGAGFSDFIDVDIKDNVTIEGNQLPGVDKWQMATGKDGDDPTTDDEVVYITYTQNLLIEEGTPNVYDQPIVVSGSNDEGAMGGATFTTPLIINDGSVGAANDLDNIFADPAVGPDGELYVIWHDIDGEGGSIAFDVDLDGLFDTGNDFGTDVTARSLVTSLFKEIVDPQPERGIHAGPVLDVDRSGGTYDGKLYLTFVDDCSACSGQNYDIFLTTSTNDGTTWTDLGTGAGNIEDSTGTEFLPWVDVDQTTGSVNVLYYTNDGEDSSVVNVRLATSIDGGANFVTSDLSTATSDEGDVVVGSGYDKDYLEYIGLVVHDGTAHALWSSRAFSSSPTADDLEADTANASFSSSTSANALVVNGDDSGTTNDTIIVRLNSSNDDFLEVLVNSVVQFTGLFATIDTITINGLNGNDTITVNTNLGNFGVTINGGAGDDVITGGDGNDTIEGGTGDDTLEGGDGSDTYVFSGASDLGTDIITETAADLDSDKLDFSAVTAGGILVNLTTIVDQTVRSGFLVLNLSSATGIENVTGSSSADTVTGNSRNNTIRLGGGADTAYGGTGNDWLYGEAGNDNLFGQDGADTAYGGTGNDTIRGGDGNDNLYGEADNDTLYGEGDDDFLRGGSGDDTAYGGTGNDYIYGDADNDTIYAGSGDDTAYGGTGNDIIYGGSENDYLFGDADDDTLHGEAGNDSLFGGSGDDTYVFAGSADLGTDTIIEAASADTDTLDFSGFTAGGILLDISDDTLQELVDNMLSINLSSVTGIENVIGTSSDDRITGNSRNNTIYLGGGNDTAYGGTGNDSLFGEAGDDYLFGEDGDDFISGGAGTDRGFGGPGNDTKDDTVEFWTE